MKNLFTLLFLTILCTCVRAQTTSSGSMMVSLGRDVITVHVSSSQGYEAFRYVDENRYRQNPGNFRDFKVISIQNRFDLTVVHQHMDSLLAKGWELTSTNYATSVDYSDLNTVDRERIYYHFKTPTVEVVPGNDPEKYTLLLDGKVSPLELGQLRGRIIQLKDETHQLIVERKNGLGWETVYQLENEGAIAGGQASRITDFRLDDQFLLLSYTGADGAYTYAFRSSANRYVLEKVKFVRDEACGLSQFSIDYAFYGGAKFQGLRRAAPCDPESRTKMFQDKIVQEKVLLRDFFAGATTARLEKADESISF
jgi:hypothetical protein